MNDCTNPDFRLGNMATDLVDYTLELCNKNEDGTLRFPKRMYDSYVTHIVNLSLGIDDNGKAVQRLLNSKKRTKKRLIRMMMRQVINGDKTIDDFVNSYQCWRAHVLNGDCYRMVEEWDEKIGKFINMFGYEWKFKGNKVILYVKDN